MKLAGGEHGDRLARAQLGGRPIAMRIWIDPDRLAALNLAPGDVHAALQRNNYLAAVGQTKGDLVQVNLLANTDLRTTDEFKNLVRRSVLASR